MQQLFKVKRFSPVVLETTGERSGKSWRLADGSLVRQSYADPLEAWRTSREEAIAVAVRVAENEKADAQRKLDAATIRLEGLAQLQREMNR